MYDAQSASVNPSFPHTHTHTHYNTDKPIAIHRNTNTSTHTKITSIILHVTNSSYLNQ